MPRYVLIIVDRPLAVFDAPDWQRADALMRSSDLAATLKDTCSGGIALWDGSEHLNYRLPEPIEEERWQSQHRANNAEFGLDEDRGLFLWLVPVDNGSPWFTMRDSWGLW
jgi:hypothetical protein